MNIFKRLAACIVKVYANYLYRKAVEKADQMYRKNPKMYYVAERPFHRNELTIYDRERFKMEKWAFGEQARLLTLETMKQRCYYHTPDTAGNQAMTERDKDRRRRAFVKERLRAAKLV